MVLAFAHSVDSFVASYTTAKERKLASELSQKVVTFLSASIYAETDSAAQRQPIHAATHRARSNAGLSSSTDPRKSRNSTVSVSSAAGQTPSSNARAPSARPTKSANTALSSNADRRILAKCNPQTLLNRPEPFILRQSLAKQIDGLTLASIPSITPTATGWAINPSDIATRDILLTQENAEVTKRTLSAYSLEIPVTWFNYAVTNVPTGFHNLIGGRTLTDASLVSEEALAQTHQHPVSCRPSRHGANLDTGKITWIISFLKPVRPFRLFDSSDVAKVIDKKTAIARHDPGCQGFCNPSRCTRYARCATAASDWTSTLAPPDPTRVNGKYIKPTRKELDAIRKHGELAFKIVKHTPARHPDPASSTGAPVIAPPKRKRGAAVTAHENAGQRGRRSLIALLAP
ncbi:hypothetical protein DID88_010304 [Monilinia fructigena]|uniref:Uncharacterized protein n=1 Tax=Monilinia fructigena TaxID=38457 RepID=A0A395ILR5_9HELO|nr:hypothetical protein DID88_010304 [Monilinia fructigena]